jgi:hypothetical protein
VPAVTEILRSWSTWQGRRTHPLRLALELAVTGWALWPLGLLLYVFAMRLTYPIDLEWMEGGTLYQAYRLIHGLPLYLSKVTNFAPYPYPPVHTVMLALVGLFHLDFWTGRLVSIGFFFLLCAVLFREVYLQQTRSSFGVVAGLLGVSVIACAYPVLGQWYDLVRVDVTMLGLLVWGAARTLKPRASVRQIVTTAILLVLAVYAKQTAAVFVVWACLFSLVREPKAGLRLSVIVGSLGILTFLALNWTTGGGFEHLVFSSLGRHEIEKPRMAEGLETVFRYAPFVAVVPLGALLAASRGWLSQRTIFWVGNLLLAIPASLVPFAKVGAYLNALLPVIVLAGPATILLLGDVARQPGLVGLVGRWSTLASFSLFVAQHPLVPKAYLPGPEKWRAANELNAIVTSLSGGVVVPYLGFLPARNGHSNPHWQSMVVWDSIWRGEPMDEILCYEQSKARWALLHSRDIGSFANHVRRHSRLDRRIPDSARVRMVTGAAVEIDELWERRDGVKSD